MLPFSSGTGVVFTFAFPGTFSTGADAESRKNFTVAADRAAKMMTTPMLKKSFVFQLRMYSRQIHLIRLAPRGNPGSARTRRSSRRSR